MVAFLLAFALAIAGIVRRDETVLLNFLWTGVGVGLFAGIVAEVTNSRAEAARKEHEAREAEEQRRRAELQRAIRGVVQLCTEAQDAALSLPVILAESEGNLDHAEDEFNDGLYSPFWEAIEAATAQMVRVEQLVNLIDERRLRHAKEIQSLGTLAPTFSVGVDVLPDARGTRDRLRQLYRRAQRNPDFASIYEQRRIASKLDRTNAILVAGFNTLGQAIEILGDRTVAAVEKLGDSVDVRLGDIQSALESAATAAAEQRSQLQAELTRSSEAEATVVGQLRRDAEKRSEHEHATRRMLDNIQRRRRPGIWDPTA